MGIGFAIPIDQARRTADEIVKTGKATQTVLGVQRHATARTAARRSWRSRRAARPSRRA